MLLRFNNRRLYLLLGAVFLLAMGYQVCVSIGVMQYRGLYAVEAAWPFELLLDSDRFSSVERAMADSGIQPGDELVQVEGQPYRGSAQIARMLAAKRPGELLRITVS
jgi:membrane-associated protease RseP (regulator of RpoE activity)